MYRVNNCQYFSARPYEIIRQLTDIDYKIATLQDNAAALHGREVDLAHIPAAEFAKHGGYVGIDFGAVNQIGSMLVFANKPITQLKRIYVDSCAGASVIVTKILLQQHWKINVPLIRMHGSYDLQQYSDNDGLLLVGSNCIEPRDRYEYIYDLTTEWNSLTSLPIVTTIWAMRPGAIPKSKVSEIVDVFHRAIRAVSEFYEDADSKRLLSLPDSVEYLDSVSHYLDEETIQGLEEFFKRGSQLGLIPDMKYQSATFSMVASHPKPIEIRKSVDELLKESMQGVRIPQFTCEQLLKNASIADLGLAADFHRKNIHADIVEKKIARWKLEELMQSNIEPYFEEHDLVEILVSSKEEFQKTLDLLEMLENEDVLKIRIVIDRTRPSSRSLLLSSLLKEVKRASMIGIKEFALLDKVLLIGWMMRELDLSVDDWIHFTRELHSLGCTLAMGVWFSPDQTWEQRLAHLHRIREIQEDCSNISRVFLHYSKNWDIPDLTEMKIRMIVACRFYLDNIDTICERQHSTDSIIPRLGLSYGASEYEVNTRAATFKLPKRTHI